MKEAAAFRDAVAATKAAKEKAAAIDAEAVRAAAAAELKVQQLDERRACLVSRRTQHARARMQ